MSSLGVVIPTRNSMDYLPAHLASAAAWLDLAAEVVVVDSQSKDGTLDYFKTNLRHPNLRLLSHPPGLYESWNHGLQNLSTDYAYISTIGETITRAGLQHLLEVAGAHGSDVVMSKPEFVFPDGKKGGKTHWPVDDMIESLRITVPRRISMWEFLVFACIHSTSGLLGSSASNLYRTAVMKANPFPSTYGKAGDGAWALQNCCRLQWSITPEICSTFLLHPDITSQLEKDRWASAPPIHLVLQETLEREMKTGRLDQPALRDLHIFALQNEMALWLVCKNQYDRARKQSRIPWILNPAAWRARNERDRHTANLAGLKKTALAAIQQRRHKSDPAA